MTLNPKSLPLNPSNQKAHQAAQKAAAPMRHPLRGTPQAACKHCRARSKVQGLGCPKLQLFWVPKLDLGFTVQGVQIKASFFGFPSPGVPC